ncbi:Uma2 family endonuclease [Singulisphaera rosea]
MSTIDRPDHRILPPLEEGQRLGQPLFHERYEAMPLGTWAELIGGVVYMPSPLGYKHSCVDRILGFWLCQYEQATPGLTGAANLSTILGPDCEVQPDQQLQIPPACGGLARIVDDYAHGPPELVIEISRSSRKLDLGKKKDSYLKAGVPEYLVVSLEPEEIFWFLLRDEQYMRTEPGPDGWYRSERFPGLWLDPQALFREDIDALIAGLEAGLATPEHAEFTARIAATANPRG